MDVRWLGRERLRTRLPRLRQAVAAWSDRRLLVVLLGGVAVLAVVASSAIYSEKLTYFDQPPIRGDGLSYYVYLPAVLLDHDVTMRRTIARSLGEQAEIAGIESAPDGSGGSLPLDPHGVGQAVLMLPFFGLGHLLAVVTGSKRDGFSWPYQATAVASGLFYVLLGLALTASVLRRWFTRETVAVTTLALAFGAGVFQYATYDATYSHGYSFFLVALALRLTISLWERPRLSAASALAATLGLVALVRPTNLVLVLFCALVGVERPGDLRARARSLARHFELVAIGCGIFIVTFMPELAYVDRITGSPFTNPYEVSQDAHLTLGSPHLIGVLFSVRKGLFFWTPLLVLAVAGLPLLRRAARPLFLAAIAYLIVIVWVVASWSQWWYGGSFGMRALIDAMPVFSLGLAALYEGVKQLRARRILTTAIAATTLLAIHGMVAYWLMAVPYDQTTWHEYLNSFVDYHAHAWNIS